MIALPGLGAIKGAGVGLLIGILAAGGAYLKGRADCGARHHVAALESAIAALEDEIAAKAEIERRDVARAAADAELQQSLQEQIDDLSLYAAGLADSCLSPDDLDRLRAIRDNR